MLSKLRTLDRFDDLRRRLTAAGRFEEALGESGKVARLSGDLTTTRMCFVAGTMVLTARGLVAIECVEVGDRVWSRDERTGVEGFRSVIDTIRTSPRQLVEITAASSADASITLTGTAQHPVYVATRPHAWDEAGFVPMGELMVGDALVLAGGAGRAHVTDVRVERGPPGVGAASHGWDGYAFRTFNLEVEGWQTYFVGGTGGAGGVWVHNSGRTCQQIKGMFFRLKEREGLTGLRALERFLERTDSPVRRSKVDLHLNHVIHEVMNDHYVNPARRVDGTIDVSRLPRIAEIEAVAPSGGRIRSAGIEVHHTVPEYVLERLIRMRYPGDTVEEIDNRFNQLRTQMPGYLVHKVEHRGSSGAGQGTGSFHSILSRNDSNGGVELGPNSLRWTWGNLPVDQIVRDLSEAYRLWQRPEVGEAARQWLRENTLIP